MWDTATRTSAPPRSVSGVEWTTWRIGILSYEDRAIVNEKRLTVRRSYNASTFTATVSGHSLLGPSSKPKRFRTRDAAMRSAIKAASR